MNQEAQHILHWAEKNVLTLVSQFVLGKMKVIRLSFQIGDWSGIVSARLGCPGSSEEVTGNSQSYCHLPQQDASSVQYFFLAVDLLSLGTCDATPLESSTGLHLSPICHGEVLAQQLRTRVQMTLIALYWSQKEGFLYLLELLVEPPPSLTHWRDLLCKSCLRWFHCKLPMLQPAVWRDSSDLPDTRVFLGWQFDSCSSSRERSPLQVEGVEFLLQGHLSFVLQASSSYCKDNCHSSSRPSSSYFKDSCHLSSRPCSSYCKDNCHSSSRSSIHKLAG